jgi:dimethylhistidine N-methyltransferase
MSLELAGKQEYTVRNSTNNFREDVLEGLTLSQKKLSSKYFYDKDGDVLFQQIMAMPEYYLTNCELDIFKNKTAELARSIIADKTPFDLIELGAGDATKSTFLLRYLYKNRIDFSYVPIDISKHILNGLEGRLSNELPALEVISLTGEYFDMLERATLISEKRKVILFLGSNIGNMDIKEAGHFCREINKKLNEGDLFVAGFDLRKNPHTILAAYNDAQGITAAFNLNLLKRINRELDSNFELSRFQHYQTYDPVSGACRSYLVSVCEQNVRIGDTVIDFKKDELIDMEISQKFSVDEIRNLADDSGFHIIHEISDSRNWFIDSIWEVL